MTLANGKLDRLKSQRRASALRPEKVSHQFQLTMLQVNMQPQTTALSPFLFSTDRIYRCVSLAGVRERRQYGGMPVGDSQQQDGDV